MKDTLIFIYSYYEFYFLMLSGIAGSLISMCFFKKGLKGTIEKSLSLFGLISLNGLAAAFMKHRLRDGIRSLPAPYLSAFTIKCALMILIGFALWMILYYLIGFILDKASSSGRYQFGILTFAYLFANLVMNRPAQLEGWSALWYATDYSMGLGSRFFIGTILRPFYGDYLDSRLPYHFCMICIIIIILLVSYISNVLYVGCGDDNRIAFCFIWALFIIGPGSVTALWTSDNFGRFETYGLLLALVSFIVYGKVKNKYISYAVMTVLSCVSIAIYQGNIFMYYALILMIVIYEALSPDSVARRKGIVLGAVNVGLTGLSFLIFQFFSFTNYTSPEAMADALSAKTDLPVVKRAIELELFSSVGVAYREINLKFLTEGEFPREKTLFSLIFLFPILIMFFALYRKCFENSAKRGKKVFETPYLYFILLIFIILPQFILNVDWGRWLISVNIVLFSGFLFLLWKKDEGTLKAAGRLDAWIREHWILALFMIIFIAGLGKFSGRYFYYQIDTVVNWLAEHKIFISAAT